jgi:uncharacterized protein YeaO (DUF488 family)
MTITKLWTACGEYNTPTGINTTPYVCGPGRIFSPSYELQNKLQNKTINYEQYKRLYTLDLLKNWDNNKDAWNEVSKRRAVVFSCTCNDKKHCHIYTLVNVFIKLYPCSKYVGDMDLTKPKTI